MKHEKYPPFKNEENQMQEVNIPWATEQSYFGIHGTNRLSLSK